MFEKSEGQERRIRESQARARAEHTRRTILDLLRGGPMSRTDLQAKLAGNASLAVVNYHLGVLLDAREIVREGGLYRLA
jgi:predicted transcriptional regulator